MSDKQTAIMVVEDEQIVALELKHRLNNLGHGVPAIAASAEEAVEAARHLRPDLVLMDIKLQGELDGIDAADLIRRNLDIPVVYLTAFADDRTIERAKATEPYGYVLKPFNERDLHVAIEVALHRHEMMRQLRETEAWRVALVRNIGDSVLAVLAVGPDRRIKLMNPKAESLTGWPEAEALGVEIDQVFRLSERPERRAPPWQDPSTQILTARNGAQLPVEAESAPMMDPDGRDLGVVWVFRDISVRKRRQDRQRLMAIAGQVASSSLDQEVLLRDLTSVIVRSLGDWCVVHVRDADDQPLRTAAFARAQESGTNVLSQLSSTSVNDHSSFIARAVHESRSSFLGELEGPAWVDRTLGITQGKVTTVAGLRAESAICVPLVVRGRAFGALTLVSERSCRRLVMTDVPVIEALGRLVAIALDNARLYNEAQRALKQHDDVLAVVSHDLKSPLAAIALSAGMIMGVPGPIPQERALKLAQLVERTTARMTRLIDDLLDVARIDSRHLALERGAHRVRDLLSEVSALFEVAAAHRSIRLHVAPTPERVAVFCDRDRILQVLTNLIGNAIKFSADGSSIWIRARERGEAVQFEVSDEAGGIATDQVEHVFEKYWRSPDATRNGTGLGLYISKGIVDAHEGRIWVDSQFGSGSTFCFTVPSAPTVETRIPSHYH